MESGKFKDQYRIASARLKGWDYAAVGWYFITICTSLRIPFFGEIHTGDMCRSTLGEIAHQYWLEIPNHFPQASLDEFVIMPDHVHGIIVINPTETNNVETQHAASLQNNVQNKISKQNGQKSLPTPGSISAIVRSYKSAVTHWAGENGYAEFRWQTRFYDRIIRDEASLANLRHYIIENPNKIAMDDDYPPRIEK